MPDYNGIPVPSNGTRIRMEAGRCVVPDSPIVQFIEGDGSGRDIWKAAKAVIDAAVAKAYGGSRQIVWYEVFAGEKAYDRFGEWLPADTVDAIREFCVTIKGPLTTPVGGGIRSLNVALRQLMTLYSCVRPVKWYPGVPSPMKDPGKLDVVIFRENTEDVYAGIEWEQGSGEPHVPGRIERRRYSAASPRISAPRALRPSGRTPLAEAGSHGASVVSRAVRSSEISASRAASAPDERGRQASSQRRRCTRMRSPTKPITGPATASATGISPGGPSSRRRAM